jgi:tetratricopeptide (TPR) repeat protein
VVGLAASDRSEPPPPAGGAAAAVDDGRRIPMFVGRFLNRTGDPRLDDTLDAIVGEVAFSSTRLDPVAGVALVGAANSLGVDPADVDAVAAKVAEHDLRRTIVVHGSVAASGAGYVVALDASDRGASHPRFASSRHADGPDDVVAVTARLAATMLEALGDPPVPAAATHVLSSSLAAVHAWSDGERHAMRDDNTGAIARYRDAVALDPEFAEARSSLGLGLYNAGARVDAITELERAVQTVDRIPERQRLTLMGDYYGSVGRYSESIMAYEQLLAKWPGDARTEINLVATALDADSWQIALEAGRRAAKDHPQYEVVRRNLVLAELGNELLDDARRDGSALLASANQPSSQALTSLMVADALLDRRDEARGLLARLRAIDPDRVPLVTADLALYEGRLDDADVALHAGSATPASQLVIARLQLRRGERAGALAAATAAMAIEGLPVEYLAASLVVDAGGSTGIADKARAWRASPEGPRRCFGALLDGDLALAAHRASDAVAAYREAARLGSSWIIHARLARGLLAADQIAEAEHELGWCLAHRGQGALVENPSLSLLPEVYVEVARSADARNADPAHVREAYRAVVDLAPAAQHDPWTELARQRLAALSP